MPSLWHVRMEVRGADAAAAVLALLDTEAGAVSAFERAPEDWTVEAYPQNPLLSPERVARLALAAAAAGGALIEAGEARLPERDWLTLNQLAFPPLAIGQFFIYGSHYRGSVPAGRIGIRLDAATAFGTGEHASTQGCLLALGDLARQRPLRDPLDIGTGTGILAIAAAKRLHRRVRASDSDPAAVAVARHNVKRNGVALLVRLRVAPGYRGREPRKRRYDLIFANILARPLALMARDLARVLAPGGRAVLSGILARQESIVLAAHRGVGLRLERRIVVDGWSTLVLCRRPGGRLARTPEAPILRLR